MKVLVFALLATGALLAGISANAQTTTPAAPAAAPAPPGDAAKGKADFLAYGCYECHGTVAQGNYFGGPHLAPGPPPWSVVSTYVRRPAGQMPSFATVILPDKDLADIYAYLRSIPPDKLPSQIPALAGVGTTSK